MDELTQYCYTQGFEASECDKNPYSYGLQMQRFCAWQGGFNDRYGHILNNI